MNCSFQGKNAKKDQIFDQLPTRERPGRQRKAPVVYTMSDDDDSEDDYQVKAELLFRVIALATWVMSKAVSQHSWWNNVSGHMCSVSKVYIFLFIYYILPYFIYLCVYI